MSISREVLAKYIKPGDVFVETGTKWGDTTIKAIELLARSVWTCEVDPLQYGMATAHLRDALARCGRPVHTWHLDSETFLKGIALSGDVVFLDAHSDFGSPVIYELSAIRDTWAVKPRVILIDDLRLMESHWKIPLTAVRESLTGMGYAIDFEDGVEKADIMVGYRLT